MRASQVAQPPSRADTCGSLTWGQCFPLQKWNEAVRLERGHCHWMVADFYNPEQKLKAFSLPWLPPRHISFHKATNSGWLSLRLHPILLSSLLCRKIENCFHCLISVPGKGKGASGLLSAPCIGTMKCRKQAQCTRGCHFRPAQWASVRTREGGALLSLLKT